MIVINEPAVAMWYVAHETPIDTLVLLERFEEHYKITWHVKLYMDGEERLITHEVERGLIPLSDAIERVREMFHRTRKLWPVLAEWEVQRGGRTLEEFAELVCSMPNATAREATQEELMQLLRAAAAMPG